MRLFQPRLSRSLRLSGKRLSAKSATISHDYYDYSAGWIRLFHDYSTTIACDYSATLYDYFTDRLRLFQAGVTTIPRLFRSGSATIPQAGCWRKAAGLDNKALLLSSGSLLLPLAGCCPHWLPYLAGVPPVLHHDRLACLALWHCAAPPACGA